MNYIRVFFMSGDTTIPDKLVHMHIAMCFFYRIVPRFHIKKNPLENRSLPNSAFKEFIRRFV